VVEYHLRNLTPLEHPPAEEPARCRVSPIRGSFLVQNCGQLIRQFDSVRVFLIALVLVSQDLFESLCSLFRNPPIQRRGMMAYEKLLPATVTPEDSHLLETYCLLSATLLYRHRLHLSLRAYLLPTSVIVGYVKRDANSRATPEPRRRSCQEQSLIPLR
jgi:hypothetical protein